MIEDDLQPATMADNEIYIGTRKYVRADALEALKRENENLRAMIRVNSMRYHGMSHADIDAAIDDALSPARKGES